MLTYLKNYLHIHHLKLKLLLAIVLLNFAFMTGAQAEVNPSLKSITENSDSSKVYSHANQFIHTIYAVDEEKNRMSLGSAVAIEEHLLATNCHVALAGDYLIVNANNKSYLGRLYYSKQAKDFCIVEITGTSLHPVQIRPSRSVKKGEDAYAIGNPDGKIKAISHGVISDKITRDDMQVLQTNVALSPGSSGGGLFDKDSKLIGITTSGDALDENLRYAIPTELIMEVVKNKNLKQLRSPNI